MPLKITYICATNVCMYVRNGILLFSSRSPLINQNRMKPFIFL